MMYDWTEEHDTEEDVLASMRVAAMAFIVSLAGWSAILVYIVWRVVR